MSVIRKLYNLVKTLNINYDNGKKCYGVSTDFIRKLTELVFITVGEKASTNIPLRKKHGHFYMDPCTYSWMTILHNPIKNQSFLIHTLTET